MADGFFVQLVMAAVQLLLGLVLSMGSVYIALRMFDKFTYGVDEWKEIRKGNVAVGLLLAAIVLSISIVIEGGVSGITRAVLPGMDMTLLFIALVIGVLNLFISILAGVIAIYVAIRVLDWITIDIDEMSELRKGNVAVAIMMAAVLIAISFVIRGAVAGITNVINAVEILRLLGM